ncbi:MAG TPA: condensation domain-containing protein [Gaiellaceae bacterium]|nr:condensation domain-containing protein [Gaiellaceae bacterium]
MSPDARAALETSLRRRHLAPESGGGSIRRRPESGPAPLSFAQQRIWFLEQWEPGGFTHNGARAFRLSGHLDAGALSGALRTIIERHEVLRTVYVVHGREPRQHVLDDWNLMVPEVDLTTIDTDRREAELRRQMRMLSRQPFDLTADLFLRATLFRLASEEYVLLVRLHHIAFDAYSDRIFLQELGTTYSSLVRGEVPELSELPIQYADYAVWQREYLTGTRIETLIAFWRDALTCAPPLLRLPIDGIRQLPQRHEGRHRDVVLRGSLIPEIGEIGRSVGATPYMLLLAAFVVLLYRISGEEDVVVGTPIANRGHAELQSLIGFFSNTIALRVRLAGNPTFREVVRRTREAAVAAYAHQELPFERVVEELRVPRDPRHNPVFQVNFRALTEERIPLELAGLRAEPLSFDIGFSRFDLALELRYESDRIGGYVEYDVDLFEDATIDELASELEVLLDQLSADPDRPILELRVRPPGRRGPQAANTVIPRSRVRRD